MDISKVRKKLKKLKADEEVKQPPKENEESGEVIDTGGKEAVQENVLEHTEESREAASLPETGIADEESASVKEIEVIAFNVANEEFAVRLSEMREILRYQIITPVPRAPRYFQGVTFLRGTVMPIINLKERLELKSGNGERLKIMVLSTSKEPVGILVRKVIDVIRIPETEILSPPSTLTSYERNFLEGVIIKGERFISVLNVNEIVRIDT